MNSPATTDRPRRVLFRHRAMDTALHQLMSLLAPPNGWAPVVVRLCGLTGVGKSEVLRAIARLIAGSPANWLKNSLPVVILRAKRQQGGRFCQKSFAVAAHSAVCFPDISWATTDSAGLADGYHDKAADVMGRRLYGELRKTRNEDQLRAAFWAICRELGVRLVIIEDAHVMASTTAHVAPAANIQPWYADAEDNGVTLLFAGTSEMHKLWDAEGECERRALPVYFERYRCERSEKDALEFLQVVLAITGEYEWAANDWVRKNIGSIYTRTYGVVGQVVKLCEAAAARARADKRTKLTGEDVLLACQNEHELIAMSKRAREYDRLATPVNSDDADKIFAEHFLGLDPT